MVLCIGVPTGWCVNMGEDVSKDVCLIRADLSLLSPRAIRGPLRRFQSASKEHHLMLWLKLLLIRQHCSVTAEFRWPLSCAHHHLPSFPVPRDIPEGNSQRESSKTRQVTFAKQVSQSLTSPWETRAVCLSLARNATLTLLVKGISEKEAMTSLPAGGSGSPTQRSFWPPTPGEVGHRRERGSPSSSSGWLSRGRSQAS